MNDHVVDGEDLREFMQIEYTFHVGVLYNLMYDEDKEREMVANIKEYYGKLAKKFKVVIDLHD